MLRKIKVFIYGLFIAVSVIGGAYSIYSGIEENIQYNKCDKIYNECEALVVKKFHVSVNNPKYYLQFKYYVDGIEYITTYKGYEFENTYEDAYIGKTATITYNPENPNEFYIKDYIDYGKNNILSGVFSIIVLPIVFSIVSGSYLYVYIEKFFGYIVKMIKTDK